MNSRKWPTSVQINKSFRTPLYDELLINKLTEEIKNRDKTRPNFYPMAYVNYRPAEVRNSGGKVFIQFSFRDPKTQKWTRIKKYGAGNNMGLNRIKDLDERMKVAKQLCTAYNQLFEEGYVPPELGLPTEDKPKDWSMFQALNLWKINTENKMDRKATIQAYSSLVNTYLKHFSGLHASLASIKKNDIESFLINLKKNQVLTATTYNSYLRITKVFFNYCVESGLLETSPAKSIKMLKAVTTKHKYFTDEELEKIKKHAPQKLLKFIQFLYETGLRPKEARMMKFKYVMGDKLFVPGSISKNKKDEYVPLSVEFAKQLQGEPEDYIFGGKRAAGVNCYGRLFSKLKETLQLDPLTDLYSTKHTRATHLIRDKVDAYAIMRLFRHSSLDITMRYIRDLGFEINRDAVEKGRSF